MKSKGIHRTGRHIIMEDRDKLFLKLLDFLDNHYRFVEILSIKLLA
jgi:hypothetical protein